jgi:hypothetical protein
MIIAGRYSFNGGEQTILAQHPNLLKEVESVIQRVNAEDHRTKISLERTMKNRVLFNPRALNNAFRSQFEPLGWQNYKIECDYPT